MRLMATKESMFMAAYLRWRVGARVTVVQAVQAVLVLVVVLVVLVLAVVVLSWCWRWRRRWRWWWWVRNLHDCEEEHLGGILD